MLEKSLLCTNILIKLGKLSLSEKALENSHAFTGKLSWENLLFTKVVGLSLPLQFH